MPVYCGNNKLNRRVRSGKLSIGTRYECLRQGVGIGLSLPVNKDYIGKYLPIDERRIYCGTKRRLPPKYDLMGNLPQCQAKGVGIGMRKKAMSRRKSKKPTRRSRKKSKKPTRRPRKKSKKQPRRKKSKNKKQSRQKNKRKKSKRQPKRKK